MDLVDHVDAVPTVDAVVTVLDKEDQQQEVANVVRTALATRADAVQLDLHQPVDAVELDANAVQEAALVVQLERRDKEGEFVTFFNRVEFLFSFFLVFLFSCFFSLFSFISRFFHPI